MEHPNDLHDAGQRAGVVAGDEEIDINTIEIVPCDKSNVVPELKDEAALLRLQRDDPSYTSVRFFFAPDGYANKVNWTHDKQSILANNTQMRVCRIDVHSRMHPRIALSIEEKLMSFCRGLAGNRSVERLYIKNCCSTYIMESVVRILRPFLEHNTNITHIDLENCKMNDESTRLFTTALNNRVNKHSLRRIEFVSSIIRGTVVVPLIAALRGYPHLVRLCLGGNLVGRVGCLELRTMLQHPDTQLKALNLQCADVDDECLRILTEGMACNGSLKELTLSQNYDITTDGWKILAESLRGENSTLETLNLSQTLLKDPGALALADACTTNITLKTLDLSYNQHISKEGWIDFLTALDGCENLALEDVSLSKNKIDDEVASMLADAFANMTLRILRLDDNKNITWRGWENASILLEHHRNSLVELDLSKNILGDEGAVAVAEALAYSPTLRVLDLSSNSSVNTVGWTAIATCFQTLSLKKLIMNMNRIVEEAAVALANALRQMATLKQLKLDCMDEITSLGWMAVSTILTNPRSSLETLSLKMNHIRDDVAVSFARALAHNDTLKYLDLGMNEITARGWAAFSSLVRATTSISDTFASNHTLRWLRNEHTAPLPGDLSRCLEWNATRKRNEIVRNKILTTHFQGRSMDTREFVAMDLHFMPRAFEWIGRDDLGRSLFYQLLRTMPALVEHHNKKPVAESRKRKQLGPSESESLA